VTSGKPLFRPTVNGPGSCGNYVNQQEGNSTIGKLAGSALAPAVALLLAACQQSENSIKIGFTDSLSRASANFGAHGERELQLVIEDTKQRPS
jgi:hypothetical protein